MSRRWISGLLAGLALVLTAGAARAVTVEKVVSPGGVEAWLVEDHSQKVLSLTFSFANGASADPADKAGLASFVAATLDEGAGDLDSGAFQGRLADLVSSLSFGADSDFFTGEVKTVTPYRDEVFDLLHLALIKPRFDADSVERIRDGLQKSLAARAEDPNALAVKLWWRHAFPDHPYGRSSRGTAKTLAGITVDDLKHFAATRLGRDRLKIALVGDIKPAELAPLLDKTFGELPAQSEVPVEVGDVTPALDGKVQLLHKPIPQSVILFGQKGLPLGDKDFYAALVMNDILGGGGFSARLMTEVRVKRGLAYGIGTGVGTYPHTSLLQGQVGTKNASVGETIRIIREVWRHLKDEGPTAAEVADAKTYLTGAYALGLDSTMAIAGRILYFQTHGLPMDYFDTRKARIDAVTPADVKRMASILLDPEHLSFTVIGDPPADFQPDATVEAGD